MFKFLLSLHVLAAILAIGPIAVAASMFPRYARTATASVAAPVPAVEPVTTSDPNTTDPQTTRAPNTTVGAGAPEGRSAHSAALLHRICRGYAVVGITVPVFGAAAGAQLGVLTDAWLLVSVVLTAAAGALLLLSILPAQRRLLPPPAGADETAAVATVTDVRSATARLVMTTGVFNLLWAVVVVLMIVRPGSTTGA